MKTIELNISENAYIVCKTIQNNKYKYISYNDVLDELNILINQIKYISIINNTITFETSNKKFIIKNYKNNKDIKIDNIIEKLINEKKRRRREYLKKQKIKRQRIFAGSIILSVGIIGNSVLSNFSPANANSNKYNIDTENIFVSTNLKNDNILDENKILTDNLFNTDYNETNEIDISFESRCDTDKFKQTKAYYKDIITGISTEYGIDPQIMLAIATQESGIHTENTNNPAIGLMQIEQAVWVGETISAYNYKKQTSETYKITQEKLKDLEFNIRVACMYFQQCLNASNYNLSVAIQMYNYGYGNIEKTFKIYYNDNINLDDALNNYDPNWLECRSNISVGDELYLEHILSYIENLDDIKCLKDTETYSYKINQKNIGKVL